jgi:hypothetical protein
VLNVPARLNARGFNVLNDIEASPSVDVLSASPNAATWINQFRAAANGGMDLFFIGGHNHYSYAGIYGDDFSPDDTCAAPAAITTASTTTIRWPSSSAAHGG